jgi:ADP-ribosylglycohydrolase
LSPTFTRPSLQKAVRRAIGELAQEPGSNETIEKLETALRLSQRNKDPVSCIEELGQGWTGEEALAIAVFCALRADSLEDGITLAVNITGDSDSTGALAGNLLGALYGYNVIPQRWLEKLELREVIETVARDLLGIHDATLSAVESCPAHPSRREQLEYYLALKEQEWWLARYPG